MSYRWNKYSIRLVPWNKYYSIIFSFWNKYYQEQIYVHNTTDWFSINAGLKQGCVLSTVMFNIFINNLIDDIKSLNIGIDIDGEKIAILLYADDVVLMAKMY